MKNMILAAIVAVLLPSCVNSSLYPYEGIQGHKRLDAYRHSSNGSLRAQAEAFDANLIDHAVSTCNHCHGHGYFHTIAKKVSTNEMVVAAEECHYCRGLGVLKAPVIYY